MSIGVRLLLSYLLTTVVAMSILASYNLASFRDYAFATMQSDLAERGEALVERVADALASGNREVVERSIAHAASIPDYTVRVFDRDGSLVASSNPEQDRGVEDWRDVPGVSDALESRPSRGRAPGVGAGREDRLYDARPIARGGELLGVVRVSMSLSHVQAELADRRAISVGVIAVTFLLCLAVGLRFAHGISAPLRKMRAYAQRLGGGSFGEPLAIERRDEIGVLARELRAMGARLARLDDERRAFLANASHEMRTPVSNVLVTLEALESGAQDDPTLRAQFLGSATDETRRLARLIQDLLDLGRLDAGVVQLERSECGLAALLGRAAAAIRPRMHARGIRVDVDADARVAVFVDPERFLQALMNVLDNALKFSPDGALVSLTGVADGADARVEVRDQGPGIAPEDRVHLFEPFYTGDASRARGGAGLGLALARRIVLAHGGTIGASPGGDAGTTFTIVLAGAARRLPA